MQTVGLLQLLLHLGLDGHVLLQLQRFPLHFTYSCRLGLST